MGSSVAAVVVAAGRGLRAGGAVPKQYRNLAAGSAIRRALLAFIEHEEIGAVQAVIHPDDTERFARACYGLDILPPVMGGLTRQASVLAGLEALCDRGPQIVLVHDAARPFASKALISRSIMAAKHSGAAIPALLLTDTVKAVDATGVVVETLDRNRLRTVQTPQAFAFEALLAAHRRAAAEGLDSFSDDAALAEWAGLMVTVFDGESSNVKLTTADDFARAELAEFGGLGDVRTASGYDVHAFGEGDHVMVGGVRIAHECGLIGHSDADVVLHALTDAILGALAEGDIGVHFPPSEPQWRGASSDRFLAFALERTRARGGRVAHLDITVVCEAPKISPYRDTIRARIAEIAGLPLSRIGLKATTSERLGFTGRREGMAALATATVRLPWGSHDG
jgi:2-C-methyl-D-erythritol 4-phosphate cytidylyltransferase / 2-C-methyl-D-erythritol 2,4-cyclodiphosphate synthase